jgi:membrane-bound lytic murein transglycosylase D
LRCDWWVDERRDPVKSTEAAVLYLKALYREFHDWELALAAYNVGEAVVRRQIRRQDTRDFWKLRLPRETRNHVPKFHAAMTIGLDPQKYGFNIQPDSRFDTETIRVDFTVDFEVLGELCGVSAGTLAELNPALLRRCTPPDDEGYAVVVPAGTGERALAELASLPEDKRVRWAHHRVRSGETVSHLAHRYRTTVRAIAEANGLSSAHRLSIGQDLLIPQGRPSGANPPSFASSRWRSGSSGPAPAGTHRVVYTVKNGDTLSEIAERYGTSTRMLRRWNRIGRFIHPGDRLTIYVRGAPRGKLAAADEGPSSFYVKVRKGDTLWDLARHYGVSLSALLNANNLRRGSLIRPGDRILIPKRTG